MNQIEYQRVDLIVNSSCFRWHGIKDDEIFDPMEKIWVKKEF